MLQWIKKDQRTESVAMKGEASIQSVTTALVSAGCEFTVKPLPDQVWRMTVRENDMPILLAAMARKDPMDAPRFRARMR